MFPYQKTTLNNATPAVTNDRLDLAPTQSDESIADPSGTRGKAQNDNQLQDESVHVVLDLLSADENEKRNERFISACLSKMPNSEDKSVSEFIEGTFSCDDEKHDNDLFLFKATVTPKDFYNIPDASHRLLINLAPINDNLSINDMLLTMRQKISSKGSLVGCFSTMEAEYDRLREKLPRFLFLLYYPLHFLFYRIFPKIPVFKFLYEFLTRGKGRFISRAEVYGRLSYCGFKTINTIELNNREYYVAQRGKSKSQETNPSFGLFVRFKRIGKKGKDITIYKIRTMHPFSEFIQKDIFERNNLNNSGKLSNDYRITGWGKVFRKYWIDELPQLLNWLKGDVKLVGVRALSEHYFSLYPEELQQLRRQVKPGLIPPYYFDLPKNFTEILKSEEKYIILSKRRPIRTDFSYFCKSFINIVLKGARSS